MERLRKLLRLPWKDRLLLLQSALLLIAIRLGLRVASFHSLQRMLERGAPGREAQATGAEIDRVGWAVRVASYFLPGTTCLPQALAVQALLTRRGSRTRVRIGVAKRGQGQLAAHAWVEDEEQRVIYDPEDRSGYEPLPPLESQGDSRSSALPLR